MKLKRRLNKMKNSLTSVIAIGLILAGASLISCENRTNPEDETRVAVQESKIGREAKKDPTLNQIVDYQNGVEIKLDELDKRIEELEYEAQRSGAETKAEFKERIEELNWKKAYAHKKLNELKSTGEESWNEVKSEMDSTMDDLEKSYENTISILR
jgi:uncharacterized coiled-coil protein SlyX